ncbi:hypothetical protein AnigIFM59636_004610 [Aspergillus niger]|nr:hypothetical protein AnigIFM59636_004610 [Aspergillus niger]
MYHDQSLPLSYSALTGSGHLQAGGKSSPASRRMIKKDKRQQQRQRQTLPSIHEALWNGNDLPYPVPTLTPPRQAHHALPYDLPSSIVGRLGTEGPSGPPNPLSSASTGPPVQTYGYPPQPQLRAEATTSDLASINTQHATNASLQSLNFGKSPTQIAKTGITSISGCQVESVYEYSAPSSPPTGSLVPLDYGAFSQPFSFQSQPQINGPAYPSASYDARPYAGALWKSGMDDVKANITARPAVVGQPQSDSIECRLDINEVETFLHEIAAISTGVMDFARHYATRAHQAQRSGPVLGRLPTIHEIKEVFNLQRRNQDALLRIRRALLKEHAFTEQITRKNAFEAGGVHDDVHMAMYQERSTRSRKFASADSRKRRGNAATTGRCHGCGRTKTPEWRRGPDGARTLCNACGLHYAKSTRKVVVDKASLCFDPELKTGP